MERLVKPENDDIEIDKSQTLVSSATSRLAKDVREGGLLKVLFPEEGESSR